MNNFDIMLLAGRTFEHAVKDAIRQRYAVVATGSIATGNGHGPRLEDDGTGVVLADLQLYRGVRAGWVEVKSKSTFNVFRNWSNRQEHGINEGALAQYQQLQTDTMQPVYLAICEISTRSILMQSIDTLMSIGHIRRGGGLANWDRAAFAKVGELMIPADDMRQMNARIDWDIFETFVTQPLLLEDYRNAN